jgi:3',5'-cyclic AMP phosphodiesterase CpdA
VTILLAHITDLHIDGTPRESARVRRVMDFLRSMPTAPDALVVTGDIADHGTAAEYAEVARLLEAPFPVFALPGNHDSRPEFRAGLLGDPGGGTGPVNRMVRLGHLALLCCDSTIPGEPKGDGRLDAETLEWITATLSALPDDVPAVLAFHHPPADIHSPTSDGAKLRNPSALAEILRGHPRVCGILNGHAHTACSTTFARVPVVIGQAVSWTLKLPVETRALADRGAPAGVALHLVDGLGRMTTHFRTVEPGDE